MNAKIRACTEIKMPPGAPEFPFRLVERRYRPLVQKTSPTGTEGAVPIVALLAPMARSLKACAARPIGMGFSLGRYAPRTEVKRFSPRAIFGYRKPERRSLITRIVGS